MNKTGRKNRICSLLLSAVLSVEQLALIMPMYSSAATSASAQGSEDFPRITDPSTNTLSAELRHEDTLSDNLDGTYTFSSDLSAAYAYSDKSMSRIESKDGTYYFEEPGKYLIELWGGDGGDGIEFFGTGKKGKGGDGGFVYGVLTIGADEVKGGTNEKKLCYEIGSKGESQTVKLDGGGTNGTGGGAGNLTIISVGAGGGYSAAYLLGQNETISESVRDDPDKVLMIAGGGGGGGAGTTGAHITAWLYGKHADGGAGGSEESSIQATPFIENFTRGTYYAGENGMSSGNKSAYVGQGGTDKPGEMTETTIGLIKSTEYPNDWQKTYHADLPRGIGGSGNLRGGGGGAGFAGGSGGLQNTIIDANNIGGGGGGSSFVNNYTFGSSFAAMSKTGVPDNYFIEKDGNDNKTTGGAIVIRYIPPSFDYSYLDDIKISGTVSKYFTVEKVIVNGTELSTVPAEDATTHETAFEINGAVTPVTSGMKMGEADTHLKYQLILRPKDGFAGGNDVNIFTGDMTCKNSDETKECTIDYMTNTAKYYNVTHLNVPMNVDYSTVNLTKGVGDSYGKNNLKNTTVTYSSTNYLHDFISGIDYEVLDNQNNDAPFNTTKTVTDADVGNTYTYTVQAVITPKSSPAQATVGNAGSGIIEKKAAVKCVEKTPLEVDGFSVYADKSLSYDKTNKTYDLDLDLKFESKTKASETNKTFYVYDPIVSKVVYDSTDPDKQPTSLDPGVYYIEAWGGDGGKGGNNQSVFGEGANMLSGAGGYGGKGSYKSGYIVIDENKQLTITLGSKGDDGDPAYTEAGTTVGKGGNETIIKIGGIDYIIAGGGGGGGTPMSKTNLWDQNSHMGYHGLDGGDDTNNSGNYKGNSGQKISSSSFNAQNIPTYFAKGGKSLINTTKVKSSLDELVSAGLLTSEIRTLLIDVSTGNVELTRGPVTNVASGNSMYYVDTDEYYLTTTYNNTTKNLTDISNLNGNGAVVITRLGVKGGYSDGTNTSTTATATDVSTWEAAHTAYYNTLKSYVKNFTLTESFSKYFDVTNATITSSGDATITDTKVGQSISFDIDLDDDTVQDPEPSINNAYSPIPGYTAIKTQRRDYSYSVDGSCSITVKLKPKTGFLGGNDVPLLDVCDINSADNNTYMSANKNSPSPPEIEIYHTDTTTSTDDDRDYVPRSYITDWANVELDSTVLEDAVTESDIFVNSGTTLTSANFTAVINGDPLQTADYTGENSWKKDFVQFEDITFEPALGVITQDTVYTLTATLSPDDDATQAVVRESMGAKSKAFRVPVHVSHSITKTLSHVSVEAGSEKIYGTLNTAGTAVSGPAYFPTSLDDDKYVVALVPETGYDLPDLQNAEQFSIVGATADVKRENNKIIITIYKDSVTDNIIITANGQRIPHKVTYIYDVFDPSSNSMSTATTEDSGYYNGTAVTNKTDVLQPTDFPDGYDGYTWTWSDAIANDQPHTMGDNDLYVIGSYKLRTYTLLIEYVYEGTNALIESTLIDPNPYISPDESYVNFENDTYDIALTKGATYNVRSPVIDGYTADKPFISGTVDDEFTPVDFTYGGQQYNGIKETVIYTANTNAAYYIVKCDNHDIPETSETAPTKAAALTAPAGYDPYFRITKHNASNNTETVIEESEIDESSGTYYVYYRKHAERPQVVFEKNPPEGKNAADITVSSGSIYVMTGRGYGFYSTSADGEYDYNSLPKAVCKSDSSSGYKFTGWYTAASGGELVTEETIVDSEGPTIPLYAQWQSDQVTITVNYKYANNITDEALRDENIASIVPNPKTIITTYGKSYTIERPDVADYTANLTDDEANRIATKDDNIIVYYTDSVHDPANDITLTVNVYSENAKDTNGQLKPNAAKITGGTFALYDGEDRVPGSLITNTNGTLIWSNTEINLSAAKTYTVVCENPPPGYGGAEIEISADDNQKDIFLGENPFKLPYAGSTPLTGYTVFGISAMLLAAFLLFMYVSSKSEEKYNEDE